MCSMAAKLASGVPMPKVKAIRPMCSIEEKENKRLMSRWRCREKAATRRERRPKPIIRWPANRLPVAASTSILQRTSAYRARFRSRPESTADTGGGPSAWASGSQVRIGASPTLLP